MISLQLSLSQHLAFSSTSLHDVSLLSSATSTPSIHLLRGLPTGLLPSSFHNRYFLGFLSISILIKCPYHFSLFLSISSNNDVTFSSHRMVVFLTLSLLVIPFIALKTLIFAACNFDSVLAANDQTSEP